MSFLSRPASSSSRPGPALPAGVAAALAAVLLALAPPALRGQEANGEEGARTTIPPEDFGKWERLGRTTLSADGEWVAVAISRVNEEDELRIHPLSDPDSVVTVPYGEEPAFSDDGRWLAYRIGMSEEQREKLQEQNRPVRNHMGLLDLDAGEVDTVEAVSSFAFSSDGRHLAMRRYPPQGRGGGGGRGGRGGAAGGGGDDPGPRGVDLVVRELSTGTDVNFGNVSEFAWQDEGPLLAMAVDAEGMAGNGVRVWDPASGVLRVLHGDGARFQGLAWREESDDLALVKSLSTDAEGEDAWADTAHTVLAFRGVEAAVPTGARGAEGGGGAEGAEGAESAGAGSGEQGVEAHVLDPGMAGFPEGHRVVPWEELRWSEDGEIVFFGVQERTEADPCAAEEAEGEAEAEADEDEGGRDEDEGGGDEAEGDEGGAQEDEGGEEDSACPEEDEEKPTVEIWHADDVEIVPWQKVRAERDRRENDLVAWHLGSDAAGAGSDGSLVRLEDDLTEEVRLVEGADWAVGLDETPYEEERMFGPVYRDVYVVDLGTGEKERALERVEYFFGASPGGRYLLYLEDDHYWTHDVETGEVARITGEIPTSFVDLEDDHTVEQKPPFGTGGWLEGDAAVLLYDEYDVWRVSPDAPDGERLTEGAADTLRHRRLGLDPDEEAVDPDAPQYFWLYDEWEETWGFARSDRLGAEVERLALEEARMYGLEKAEDADVYTWVVQDFEDSPDLFAGGPELDGRQVTRTNPFQDDYLWGRSELIEYTNDWGDTLQGALYYPAGYEPGRTYPMITYIYEIRSPAVRSYDVPSERDYYNFQTWVQDGYFVFQPDILYRDRDPGMSAVANVVPAVERVIETGLVDPERIGLVGHSWGGYQTTFLVTQTDIFAAAVAGAPLTNLFSMYLSVYWNSGGTDARIFEISQGRMEVPFWEDEEAYRRNSPVFHIERMDTPLLMAQGTEDGAVDFNQGVEFYNAARRADKDFVFLVYNDENHGFRQEPNQLDYHRRIDEWFGHYLKGEEAPEWIEEGVPYLEQPGGEEGPSGR